jgi:hypothetical protein
MTSTRRYLIGETELAGSSLEVWISVRPGESVTISVGDHALLNLEQEESLLLLRALTENFPLDALDRFLRAEELPVAP